MGRELLVDCVPTIRSDPRLFTISALTIEAAGDALPSIVQKFVSDGIAYVIYNEGDIHIADRQFHT